MNWEQTITYEQPFNELVRVCLRLEQLFQKIQYYQQQESTWASSESLHSMLEIVTIAERPELKSGLYKELTRHHCFISSLKQKPGIDQSCFNHTLEQLSFSLEQLNESQGKFAADLKTNEFLNAIRMQLSNIGGACNINTPLLKFWLHQPNAIQQQQLSIWMKELNSLQDTITLLLKLIRGSSRDHYKTATHGFYEMGLDPKLSLQLLRLELPVNQKVYPEISSGRHRVCIRFLKPDFFGRETKAETEILFKLAICIL